MAHPPRQLTHTTFMTGPRRNVGRILPYGCVESTAIVTDGCAVPARPFICVARFMTVHGYCAAAAHPRTVAQCTWSWLHSCRIAIILSYLHYSDVLLEVQRWPFMVVEPGSHRQHWQYGGCWYKVRIRRTIPSDKARNRVVQEEN